MVATIKVLLLSYFQVAPDKGLVPFCQRLKENRSLNGAKYIYGSVIYYTTRRCKDLHSSASKRLPPPNPITSNSEIINTLSVSFKIPIF